MTDKCSDPNFCRNGCCRNFLGRQFCDIQSNCYNAPTQLIIIVPAVLIISALVLFIFVMIRLKNRQTTLRLQKANRQRQLQDQGQGYNNNHVETDRNFLTPKVKSYVQRYQN